MDIEERAASSAGSSTPRQPYLSSADSAGVPQLSVPSSSHPAVVPPVILPASAETETPESGGGASFGDGGGVSDLEGTGAARRQVARECKQHSKILPCFGFVDDMVCNLYPWLRGFSGVSARRPWLDFLTLRHRVPFSLSASLGSDVCRRSLLPPFLGVLPPVKPY